MDKRERDELSEDVLTVWKFIGTFMELNEGSAPSIGQIESGIRRTYVPIPAILRTLEHYDIVQRDRNRAIQWVIPYDEFDREPHRMTSPMPIRQRSEKKLAKFHLMQRIDGHERELFKSHTVRSEGGMTFYKANIYFQGRASFWTGEPNLLFQEDYNKGDEHRLSKFIRYDGILPVVMVELEIIKS